jgi:hypothetical protein
MANSGKPGGNKQPPSPKGALKCGDVGVYSKMQDRPTNRQQRDHVPATNSMLKAGEAFHKGLSPDQVVCFKRYVKSDALTIAIPKQVHRQHSRTCSNRGGDARRDADAADLKKAANDDMDAVKPKLSADCQEKYEEARKKVLEQLPDKLFKECKAKALKNC